MSVSIKDLNRDPNLLTRLADKLRYKFTGWKVTAFSGKRKKFSNKLRIGIKLEHKAAAVPTDVSQYKSCLRLYNPL